MTDRYSGRPKGFAFVEMPLVSEWQAAIPALSREALKERTLTVNVARPRSDDRVALMETGEAQDLVEKT